MFTVTLLGPPDRHADLEKEAAHLSNHWHGGARRWLGPGCAEFDTDHAMPDRAVMWEELDDYGIDLVIQPAAGRLKKVLLADMDSTMIDQECIDELADVAGFGAEVSGITARAMNGELDFEAALDARVALLKGLPVSVIADVLRDRIHFAAGARTLIATARAKGLHCVLVSGGFTRFTGPVAAELSFHENYANVLLDDGAALTGHVAKPVLGKEAKVERLDEVTTRLGLSAADVIAVGDGANDLPMLKRAGTGVALHAKPAVAAQSEIRVNHGDLTALLYLMGIPEANFVHG